MGMLALPEAQRPQRYRRKEGNLAYSSGNTATQLIGQTAYLTQLDLISLQTVTTTTTAPTGGFGTTAGGAFAPLTNVQVKLNGGRAPFSMPGYHADLYTRVWDQDYQSGLTTNPITGNTTNNWVNHLRCPVTIDPISERGAFYAGDTALNITFALTMAAVASVFQTVNAATIGGSWDLWSEKFEAPQPDQSATPQTGGWLDKISYYNQAQLYGTFALSNGTTNITLETDQDFVRVILVFYTGTLGAFSFAPADALYTTLSLKVNDVALLWDTVTEAAMRFEMAATYLNVLPAGTCVLDFMRLRPPSRRDILPTDPNIAKRLVLQIASTSSSNNVDVITQTVTPSPFASKWIALASKQGA